MITKRKDGEVQPGLHWGPFTMRIPFIHIRLSLPDLLQGFAVAGATGLALVPYFMDASQFQAMTALSINFALILFVLGVTGLGAKLIQIVPAVLKGGIILGAAIAAFLRVTKDGHGNT